MSVRSRLLALVALAATVATVILAGCGGGSSGNAKALLKRGFGESISSANVTVDISVQVAGVPQLAQPIRITLGGPYKSNGPKTLPSLNWDIGFLGGGQRVTAGLISTGDHAFVNYQGTAYKISDTTVAQLKAAAASSNPSGSRSLKSFGIDALSWIKDAKEEGDDTVAGVTSKHVSAGVDVGRLFADLNKVVAKAGGTVGSVRPQQLSPQIIDSIKKVVKDPHLDVYVGKRDGKIRRVALSLQFSVPKQSQAKVRGVQAGTLKVSVEFAGVGEPQTIQAPANSKPIAELINQFRGLGGLGGAASGIGGGSTGGLSGGGGGAGTSPPTDKFKKYGQCISRASPSDTAAIQRCSALLK